MWRCAVMTMPRDTEVRQPNRLAACVARTERCRLGANCTEGCRAMQWSDRLSLKSACGLRVSRLLRAVSRRPLEVGISGWPSAVVEPVQRLSAHRGQGRAYYQGAQGVVPALRQVELTGRQREWRPSRNKERTGGVGGTCGADREFAAGLSRLSPDPLSPCAGGCSGFDVMTCRIVAQPDCMPTRPERITFSSTRLDRVNPLCPLWALNNTAVGECPCVHQSSVGGRMAATGGSLRLQAGT